MSERGKVDKWGVGDQKDAKAFDQVKVGSQTAELIFGQYPHSRQDNNVYVRYPARLGREPEVEGFNGHRVLERVEVSTANYLKTSGLSGNEIRKSAKLDVYLNDVLVYSMSGREVPTLMLRYLGGVRDRLLELGVHLWKEEERRALIGRKVWYDDQKAIITNLFLDQGCIWVEPEEGGFRPPWYAQEDGSLPHDSDLRGEKVDILHPGLAWHRER